MIRVNLLPVPKVRKQEALIVQTIIGIVILALIAVGCYFIGSQKRLEIARVQQQISDKQRAIDELKAKVGEVEKFKQQAKVLEQQLSVIKSLEAGRSGPVKMMDELTEIAPRKLWISSFKEMNKKVTIDGIADSGPVIADLLENLKTAKYFSNPQLSVVQGQEQDGVKLHRFSITMGVRYDL